MRISDWSSDVCSSDLLLLVAVMAVLVMSVLDDIRFGLRRASKAQSMAQAQWYARGAETLAMAQIDRLASRTPDRTTLAGDWNGRQLVFPVQHARNRPPRPEASASSNPITLTPRQETEFPQLINPADAAHS